MDALLEAILANPDEDQPRLMYADWLLDRGDALGELITIGCHLAALPRWSPARRALSLRHRNLLTPDLRERLREPLEGLGAVDVMVERGFVIGIELPLEAFVAHAEAIFRTAPLINRVSLRVNGPLAPLRAISQLARVRHLRLVGDAPLEAAGPLFASEHFRAESLEARLDGIDLYGFAALATPKSPIRSLDLYGDVALVSPWRDQFAGMPLERLTIRGSNLQHVFAAALVAARAPSTLKTLRLVAPHPLSEQVVADVCATPNLANLEELRLFGPGVKLPLATITRLADRKTLPKLRKLDLLGYRLGSFARALLEADRLTELELQTCGLGEATVRTLFDTPGFARLRSFRLTGEQLSGACVRALAAAPVSGLAELQLDACGLHDGAALELAYAPMPALEQLQLRRNFITQAGLSALARSPRLTALWRLFTDIPVPDFGLRAELAERITECSYRATGP